MPLRLRWMMYKSYLSTTSKLYFCLRLYIRISSLEKGILPAWMPVA